MRNILYCLIVSIFLSGCAGAQRYSLTDATRRAAGQGITDGIYKEYYKDGTVKMELGLKSGKLHGPAKAYYPNGRLTGEINYVDGRVEGEYKNYYESGELLVSGQAVDDKKNGWEKEFYKSGVVKKEVYFDYGKAVGEVKSYYEDGRVHFISEIDDGSFRNIREFAKDGRLIRSTELKFNEKEALK